MDKKKGYLADLEAGDIAGKEKQIKFENTKLKMVTETIEAYKIELEAMTNIMEICSKDPQPLKLRYKYEEDPVYWENHVKIYRVEKQRMLSDINIKLLQAQENKDSIDVRLKELQGE